MTWPAAVEISLVAARADHSHPWRAFHKRQAPRRSDLVLCLLWDAARILFGQVARTKDYVLQVACGSWNPYRYNISILPLC